MNRFVFVFVDGIGIGAPGSQNPFDVLELPGFDRLSAGASWTLDAGGSPEQHRDGEHVFLAVDANLGMDGLPQSGTGQASLFTGVNCARLAGRHYGPYPHSKTLDALAEESLFARIPGTAFANAYPDRFFEWAKRNNRWSTTTRCCLQSDIRIRTMEDLAEGRALAADITGAGLSAIARRDVTVIDEAEAAHRLLKLAGAHPLTVFEYFHTDKAGHNQSFKQAEQRLTSLSAFFEALMHQRPPDTTLLLCSDHGNLEDLSVKTHTRNPVPLAVVGPCAGEFANCSSITDVAPAVVRCLTP